MIDALQTATTGMTRASDRFGNVAQTIASAGAPVAETALQPAAQVDLSSAAAELVGSKSAFALNAAVARTADRMTGRLLDINA
ncbi:flagellar protein [Methylobacterium sp. J-026]|uniref:flagellar protein n=1 Tax=Methylobacterium sp. J-026 TaxID=2836624 RepID=UPI001FB937C5|nr:flagellar protein [Methylobacterium sp. J-026]MCJ2137891.1 flagellar protein [Methylobacterium sp. J-026]